MIRAQRQSGRALVISLCVIFFLSGASSLIYQLVWLRTLGLIFGVTIYAASTVWASFMAGLAIGSAAAGRLADRVRRPLLWFAAAEAGIALAATSTTLAFAALQLWYPRLVPGLEGSFVQATTLRFAIAFLVLIVPTALMGATLPLVVKSSMLRTGTIGAVGALYASNTSGAIVGSLIAGLWFIPVQGMRTTFVAAAAINLLAAVGAVLISRTLPVAVSTDDPTARAAGLPTTLSTPARGMVLVTFTVSGAVALALEVVWLRSATIIAGPTVYTVAVLLATILAGIALGSYCITPFLGKLRRPLLVLATIEVLIAATILCSLASLTRTHVVVESLPGAAKALLPAYLMPVVVGALLVAFPTSWLMGLAFPLGLQLWTESAPRSTSVHSASRLGAFYALNVGGGIVGSVGAGFVLLPVFGSRAGIVALAAATLATAVGLVVVVARSRLTRIGVPLALTASLGLVATRLADPIATLLALRLPGRPILWREEGIQTTASVHSFFAGQRLAMYLDGYHQAGTDGGALAVHYRIGALPLALHPNPHSALVVGLGGGATAGAMSRHSRLNVEIVELSDTVVRASDFFRQINFDLLSRPNVRLRIDDGRNYLLSVRRRYDIITADTIQPVRAGSASLYSREYFALVRERLNEDGVAVQWFSGTDAEYRLVARTFADVFPYVTAWAGGTVLVGTNRPLKISPSRFNWKLEIPDFSDALGTIGIRSFEDLLREFWGGPTEMQRYVGTGPVLTDDRPILEYFLALPRDRDVNVAAFKGSVEQIIGE